MVKVYKFHNFKSQNVIPVTGEPVALFAHKNRIFVATHNCSVEVFTSGTTTKYVKINSFSSEAQVKQILYNETGNYVATIEYKKSRRQDYYAVKVYLNWQLATEQHSKRACVRLAGRDHSLKPSSIDKSQLQVVDVPCQHRVSRIATCQQTGNLAIVQKNVTDIYHLVEKTIPKSDKTYMDVVLFLKLKWGFEIENISICEDYFSVISTEQAQVVRVLYLSKQSDDAEGSGQRLFPESYGLSKKRVPSVLSTRSQGSDRHMASESSLSHSRFSHLGSLSRNSTTPSPALSISSLSKLGYDRFNCIQDDQNFVQWNFDDFESRFDSESWSLARRQTSKKTPKTIILKGLQELSQRDLMLAETPEIKDFRGGGHVTMGEVQVITLLYKRRSNTEDSWHFVQLIPKYLSCNTKIRLDMAGVTPVHSASYSSLIGMACLLSGKSSGFMYNLWLQSSLLSTYKYTQEVKQIRTDGELLYVLNDKGVEVYTCRANAASIHNMEDIDGKTKAYPEASLETCLCGIHPFMGTFDIAVDSKEVILLSKIETSQRQDDCVWSLYALEKCGVAEIYKDMLAFGTKSQANSQATYLHMLQEGHVALRCALIGSEDSQSDIQDLYRESCALLGEHYALPESHDWHLSLPYYLMSRLSIADIVKQALQYKQHSKKSTPYCYGKGFLNYLDYVLFQDEEIYNLKESDSNLILEVCSEAVPDKLSEIILVSSVHSFSAERALKLLQSVMQNKSHGEEHQSAVDMLALAYLHLKLCDPDPAQVALNSIPQKELIKICIKHHQLLHQEFTELSPLSQLMRCHCPYVLIQSLVSLHDTGMIPLDLAIKLLQGSNTAEDMYKNNHVKEYLEVLLEDLHRKYIFEEAVVLLTDILVKRLKNWTPPTSKFRSGAQVPRQRKNEGHFGQRFSWLDELPPFSGPASMKQPCIYLRNTSSAASRTTTPKQMLTGSNLTSTGSDLCHCCHCHDDLIKLQSILCSDLCKETVATKVMDMLESDTNIDGYDSIWLLCRIRLHDIKQTFSTVVEKYPHIVLEYGKSVLEDGGLHWQDLLQCLLAAVKLQAQNADNRERDYLHSLTGVLRHLADVKDVQVFLRLLPNDGNLRFFLPFILECQEKEQSRKLRSSIVSKGEHLQMLL